MGAALSRRRLEFHKSLTMGVRVRGVTRFASVFARPVHSDTTNFNSLWFAYYHEFTSFHLNHIDVLPPAQRHHATQYAKSYCALSCTFFFTVSHTELIKYHVSRGNLWATLLQKKFLNISLIVLMPPRHHVPFFYSIKMSDQSLRFCSLVTKQLPRAFLSSIYRAVKRPPNVG